MKKTTPGSQIVPQDSGALPTAVLLEAIRTGAKLRLAEDPSEDAAARITAQKAAATTADELFGAAELTKVADVLGQPFRLLSIEWRNSDEVYLEEGALGVYVILHVAFATGEVGAIATGANDALIKANRTLELGLLDEGEPALWLQFVSEKTNAGYRVYNLIKAQGPASTPDGAF